MAIDKLMSLGQPATEGAWLNYAEQGVTSADVSALVELAGKWEPDADAEPAPADWAPVHAWRALAELQVDGAVGPLLALMNRLEESPDDWGQEELPEVFARIGPKAIDTLGEFVQDSSNGLLARGAAIDGLEQIGRQHAEQRDRCVALLVNVLQNHAQHNRTLNAFVLVALVELRALEAVPLMRTAFASNNVDELLAGTWEQVRKDLGLPPEKTPAQRRALADQSRAREQLRQRRKRQRSDRRRNRR